jgi:probable HAF family extracellular repeat protein
MGDLTGRNIASSATAVSADGSVIVGRATSEAGIINGEAFRWTADDGMVGLGDLPGGSFISAAFDMSDDGAVVVGQGTTINGLQAFRWTAASGMVGLGGSALTGYGVSADGSVIVGQASSTIGSQAFYWTEALGVVNLRDLLIANGSSNLSGWNLISAEDVSSDGLTIVGFGTNPAGDTEAWVATIPEPATILLAVVAAGAALLRRLSQCA